MFKVWGGTEMKRIGLFVLVSIAILTGCEEQAEVDMKEQINFVPNEDYVGDPHPVTEEKMKLTEEEQQEFEQLQQEIFSEKEGE